MNKYLILLTLIFISCEDLKYQRKIISQGAITVEWYFEPTWRYITPERVVIKKGKEEVMLFKASDAIVDIDIKYDSILIKLYKPHRAIIYTKNPPKHVWNYRIVIDTTGSYKEYRNRPRSKEVYF
ncbi:hypothetical protein MASR2M44_08030 [Bacteroidota bacterium]